MGKIYTRIHKILTATRFIFLISGICFLASNMVQAGNPEYEARRVAYIDYALNHVDGDVLSIQAAKGIPVNQQALRNILDNVSTRQTADFDIIKLVRILMFSHGEYDSLILPVLRPLPFWLEKNETVREYWSENHMIMWMASDWLLHEKYGKAIDSTLDRRLRHYLKLKVQYGFYEFNSTTYAPYCLTGLLNLADFAQDAEIKSLATQAAQKLLKEEILLLTSSKGVLFPTAGRNYPSKYESAYGQNHNSLTYLLTGLGPVENGTSHSGAFLATTTVPVDDVISSWKPLLDTVYTQGHTLQNGIQNINNTMSVKDKVIFQWSSGAYFHPDVAQSTFQLLKDLDLWDHYEFDDFRQFSFLPSNLAAGVAEIASPISKSSGIYNPTIAVFKNKAVTLSSLQDFWKGKVGYQQFPIMVNAGTSAVFTLSGTPNTDWDNRPSHNANTHLPYVQQKSNVALVMYRPEKGLALFGYKDAKLDVSLHWQNDKFDEIRENGNWLLGREGDGYVAVRRSCTGEINGVRACDNPDGQTWVFMVGNSDMYGSFDAFEQKIIQSQYTEKWYFNLPTLQWVYYSKIVIDGKTLEYAWNGDILSGPTRTTGIRNAVSEDKSIAVYPNPAKDALTLDLSSMMFKSVTVRVLNIAGQEVYSESIDKVLTPEKTLLTADWPEGAYFLTVNCEQEIHTQKIIISH